jgi:hypothetical protein
MRKTPMAAKRKRPPKPTNPRPPSYAEQAALMTARARLRAGTGRMLWGLAALISSLAAAVVALGLL